MTEASYLCQQCIENPNNQSVCTETCCCAGYNNVVKKVAKTGKIDNNQTGDDQVLEIPWFLRKSSD